MSASLQGQACTRARVQIPAWGRPWADVSLPTEVALAEGAAASLVVADVPIVCAVVSGGVAHGDSGYRLVAGRGTWSDTIPSKSYNDDAGVKMSSVLADAAAACGEAIDVSNVTARLGPHYARRKGPASDVLNTLAPRGWYVGLDGVTRIGARPSTAYTGTAARTRLGLGVGVVELAFEGDGIAALVPGVTVDGSSPATDVEWLLEPRRLTVKVWAAAGGAQGARLVGAVADIVAALTAPLAYAGVYEFRVVTRSGAERLNLQPVRAATGIGDLSNVPVRPGVAGMRANATLGSLVLVAFVDRDPSRPVVVAHDSAESPGWMPELLELGGPGALGVARIGDAVQAGPYTGVITSGSARVKAAV